MRSGEPSSVSVVILTRAVVIASSGFVNMMLSSCGSFSIASIVSLTLCSGFMSMQAPRRSTQLLSRVLRFSVVLGVRFLSLVYVCAGGDENSAFLGAGLSGFGASLPGVARCMASKFASGARSGADMFCGFSINQGDEGASPARSIRC